MSIRGVVFDFWIDEYALRNFPSAGASDWAEMEHRAWDYVVHYPAPRYAFHGGDTARANLGYSPGVFYLLSSGGTQNQRAPRARARPTASFRSLSGPDSQTWWRFSTGKIPDCG